MTRQIERVLSDAYDSSSGLLEDMLRQADRYKKISDIKKAKQIYSDIYQFKEVDEARDFLREHCPYDILCGVPEQDTFFVSQIIGYLERSV